MRARAGLIGWLAIALSVPLLAQTIPPASIADKEMSFDLQGKAGPNDQMFISRIKITKN